MALNRYSKIIANQQLETETFSLDNVCRRKEEEFLDFNSPLAQIVIGVRRCGKSTLCHTALKSSNVTYAYVNFDDERLSEVTSSDLDDILEALYIVYGNFTHLFLDEIQNVKGWDLFVNRLLRQNIRLIITGSNAKLLSGELSTHLTGRYNKIELYPFSFEEYLNFKGLKTKALSTKDIAFQKLAFEEYLYQGGFPETFNLKNKKAYISAVISGILNVDIQQRFKIRYMDALHKIAYYLIANFAQELNYKSLAQIFEIKSQHTVANYVSYLKQTYLLVGIHKFSFKAKERITGEKMYLIDPSLLTMQDNKLSTENIGWKIENIVCLELLRRKKFSDIDIYYHRTRYEIDFVICQGIKVLELIQVSTSIENEKTLKRECNALLNGSKDLRCEKLTLLTLGDTQIINYEGTKINEINLLEWLTGNC